MGSTTTMGASEIPPERDCAYLSNRRASPRYPDRATCEAGNNIRDAVPASTSTSIQAIGTPGRQPPASDQRSRKGSDCHSRLILHSATDNQKEQLDREIWEAIQEVFQDNEAWCEAGQSNLRATFDDQESWLESVVQLKVTYCELETDRDRKTRSKGCYQARLGDREVAVAAGEGGRHLLVALGDLELAMEDIDRVCHDEEVQKEKEETLGLRGGDGGLRVETEVDIAAGIDIFAAMPKEACGRRQALQVCERKMWWEEQAIPDFRSHEWNSRSPYPKKLGTPFRSCSTIESAVRLLDDFKSEALEAAVLFANDVEAATSGRWREAGASPRWQVGWRSTGVGYLQHARPRYPLLSIAVKAWKRVGSSTFGTPSSGIIMTSFKSSWPCLGCRQEARRQFIEVDGKGSQGGLGERVVELQQGDGGHARVDLLENNIFLAMEDIKRVHLDEEAKSMKLRLATPDKTKKLRRSFGAINESDAHTLNPLQLLDLPSYCFPRASYGWRDDSCSAGITRWRRPSNFAQSYPRIRLVLPLGFEEDWRGAGERSGGVSARDGGSDALANGLKNVVSLVMKDMWTMHHDGEVQMKGRGGGGE
ncbi:hypothetical protein BKA70DRAFT_1220798 [Coprinopsis sp. MPI-PUGE-AT-0042]|nr:hypothetical protein BKA70DRAFT_1220798 [Coprinopsis sp. MPI-PUGE-AT-0042]